MFYHQILDMQLNYTMHARKLMYSINVFQKKEDEVNVIDDVFFIFAKIAYKNFTNFMNFNGKRFYM